MAGVAATDDIGIIKKEAFMRNSIGLIITAAALAAAPLASHALGTNEKGCLVGGAAGGVVGHNVGSGNNTLLGAAVGCGAGVLINKERVKKIDAKEQEKKVAARKRHEAERRHLAEQQGTQPLR
jgi:outer membrane lipoprotein SlyB